MAELQTLRVEPRDKLGKGPTFQTRQKGLIPGIVYGGKEGPRAVQVDERNFTKLYTTGTLLSTLLMLELDGEKTRVIPRDVQLDPVTDRPLHVDFLRLAEGARIALHIPVHFRGQENSPGIKRGGVLNIVRHTVELYCPADRIPPFIEGDLNGLDIGDSLHISAFTLPEGVKPVVTTRDFTVATIAPPTTYVEETPVAAAAEAAVEGAEGAAVEGATPGVAPGAAEPAAGAAAEKGKGAEKPAKK
jgi:large subunit ribosomal protein L25